MNGNSASSPRSGISGVGDDRRARRPTVLIVDDDSTCIEVLDIMLRREDCAVHAAVGGDDALRFIASNGDALDLVLLDWQMPGLSGATTLRELRLARPNLPVVVVSGIGLDTILETAPAEWLAGYIGKPWRRDELRETLRRVLDGPR